ncbi:MAG: peptide chain release factor 2 [Deltaproteobacteria bacterium]|nr:peptide chain release factor 2 [Deltaproteobacteria bacterium]
MNYGGVFDLGSKLQRISELENISSNPDFWNDADQAKQLGQELESLKTECHSFQENEKQLEDVKVLLELAEEENDESVLEEVHAQLQQLQQAIEEIEFRLMLGQPEDRLGAILTINAGAGGTESCDWAEILMRMYLRYTEKHHMKTQLIEYTAGEEAGCKSVTFSIEGEYAYGYLKGESGVHRLVRISPFDANKRRHTSFASVYVSPQVDETIEIEIKKDDLRIDTYRAGGKGGQNVQKNDTAVRITHLPTNIVVQCQSERSQHQNKSLAMKVLKSRIYELELEKQRAEQQAVEANKKKIEWGSQIRSYVLHPYKMVKDHRTDFEMGNADAVLDGELDGFIHSYLLGKPLSD